MKMIVTKGIKTNRQSQCCKETLHFLTPPMQDQSPDEKGEELGCCASSHSCQKTLDAKISAVRNLSFLVFFAFNCLSVILRV